MMISAAVAFAFSTIVVNIPPIAFIGDEKPNVLVHLKIKGTPPENKTPLPPKKSNMKAGGKTGQQHKAVGQGKPNGAIT